MSAIHQTTSASSSMGVAQQQQSHYSVTNPPGDDLSPSTSSSLYVNNKNINNNNNNNNNSNSTHSYTTTSTAIISPVSPMSTSSSSGGSSAGTSGGSVHNRHNSLRNLASMRKRSEKLLEDNNGKSDCNDATTSTMLHNITNTMTKISTRDAELIAIKSKFEAEFRRFSMQRSELTNLDSFRSLIEHFHRLFNIQFCLFYTDPVHGDQLPISNDNNFRLAISSAKPLLRIVVQRKGEIFDSYPGVNKKKNFLGQILPSSNSTSTRPKISLPEDFRQVSSIIDVDIVPDTCRRVRLVKHGSDKPLGFYIRDGTSVRVTAHGLEKVPGIFISRLVPGGLAESTGLLAVNDEVLEVNGIEVHGKSLDQVTDMMVANSSNLIITIRPANQSRAGHAALSTSFSSNTISTSTPSHHANSHHHGSGHQTNSLERRQHSRPSKHNPAGPSAVAGNVLRSGNTSGSQHYRYSQLYSDTPARPVVGPYEYEHLQRSNSQRHSAHRLPTSQFSARQLHQANPVYRSVCLVNHFGATPQADARRALQGPSGDRLASVVPDIVNLDDDDDDDEDEVKDHFTDNQQHHF